MYMVSDIKMLFSGYGLKFCDIGLKFLKWRFDGKTLIWTGIEVFGKLKSIFCFSVTHFYTMKGQETTTIPQV